MKRTFQSIISDKRLLFHLSQFADFISDVGGQLGLWIGFSVLTVAEFLELFMLLLHAALKKCRVNKIVEPTHVP